MYRGSGLLLISVGSIVVYFLAFTTFEEPVGRWTRPEEGSGFIQVKIECPSAWDALIDGERFERRGPERDQCVRAARTHMTGALIVAIGAGVLGVRGILRGAPPAPQRLRPLSDVISRREHETDTRPRA